MVIIFLVLSSRGIFYDAFLKEYWVPMMNYLDTIGIKVYFNYGKNCNIEELKPIINNEERILISDCNEGVSVQKTLLAFEQLVDGLHFDYLFRTTLTSIIEPKRFLEWFKSSNFKTEGVYNGVIIPQICVSGAGFLLSKDLVKYVVDNKTLLRIESDDDVGLYLLLAPIVTPTNSHRIDITSEGQIHQFDTVYKHQHHFRFRSGFGGNNPIRNVDLNRVLKIAKTHMNYIFN
jgi:hypothetical protein